MTLHAWWQARETARNSWNTSIGYWYVVQMVALVLMNSAMQQSERWRRRQGRYALKYAQLLTKKLGRMESWPRSGNGFNARYLEHVTYVSKLQNEGVSFGTSIMKPKHLKSTGYTRKKRVAREFKTAARMVSGLHQRAAPFCGKKILTAHLEHQSGLLRQRSVRRS